MAAQESLTFTDQVARWAAPALMLLVSWFIQRHIKKVDTKFDEIDKKIDENQKANSDALAKAKSSQELFQGRIDDAMVDHAKENLRLQRDLNNEIHSVRKLTDDLKVELGGVKQVIDMNKEYFGKVIHLETTTRRHEGILVSSAKVMKLHSEKIRSLESDKKKD